MPDAKTTVMERVRNVCHDNAVRAARYGERHRDAGNCPKDADLRALLKLADAAGHLPCVLDDGDFTMVRNTHLRALTDAYSRVTQAEDHHGEL